MRIGFILSDIDNGISASLWPFVAKAFASGEEDSLYIFPGGRLNGSEAPDVLKNSIYPLVSRHNLDAAIIWSSSLTGTGGTEEVFETLSGVLDIPLVTITGKTNARADIPDVSYDAYNGMKMLIRHCIEKHGAQKIAYIRGPENHAWAMARFGAYKDAHAENGMTVDSRLVSDPRDFTCGRLGIKQLIEDRHLVPGVDFDTILCASDLIMTDVNAELQRIGCRVPEDVRLCGFNDSNEAHILHVPATTVSIPYARVAEEALSSLYRRISGETPPDVYLEAKPVIRRSCGCSVSFAENSFENMPDFISFLSEIFDLTRQEAGIEFKKALTDNTEFQIREFVSLLCRKSPDIFAIKQAIDTICKLQFLDTETCTRLCSRARDLLPEVLDRVNSENRHRAAEKTVKLNRFKCNLLGANTINEINLLLQKSASELDLEQVFLVVPAPDGTQSVLVDGKEGQRFPVCSVLPAGETGKGGVYIVEPLHTETEELGYLVVKTAVFDGETLEEIRSSVSSAIKTAMLFEETAKARTTAENAEEARRVFFANVGENLRDPLSEIAGIAAGADGLDGTQKQKLMGLVTNARHIIDLALSETGELELNRHIFSISKLLEKTGRFMPEAAGNDTDSLNYTEAVSGTVSGTGKKTAGTAEGTGTTGAGNVTENTGHGSGAETEEKAQPGTQLPCLFVDEEKLVETALIIINVIESAGGRAVINASLTHRGVRIDISDSTGRWKYDGEYKEDGGLVLARKIIILHGGTCSVSDNVFTAILPYPTLSGGVPELWEKGRTLACFGGMPDFDIEGETFTDAGSTNFKEKNLLPLNTGAIYWDAKMSGYDALACLQYMCGNEYIKKLPFLCTSCTPSKTLEDAIRGSVETGEHVVLHVGPVNGDLFRWLQDPEVVSCSFDNAVEMCRKTEPDLVVLSQEDFQFDAAGAAGFLSALRSMRRISQTPVLICADRLDNVWVSRTADVPNVIIVNSCILESEEFAMRIRGLLDGEDILPTLTGAIVKKAQGYICAHAASPLSRWQIAGDVHVSEDYLTRVFKRELGLSPWDYLNRYRIWLACQLLRNTGMTISEVSQATGFQDQAYFCRVFKKIKGFSPGRLRSSKKSEMYKF